MKSPAKTLVLAVFTALEVLASEYRGVVQSNGLPVPGAMVTATRGDQKAATSTDEKGAFSFKDLADGQ